MVFETWLQELGGQDISGPEKVHRTGKSNIKVRFITALKTKLSLTESGVSVLYNLKKVRYDKVAAIFRDIYCFGIDSNWLSYCLVAWRVPLDSFAKFSIFSNLHTCRSF